MRALVTAVVAVAVSRLVRWWRIHRAARQLHAEIRAYLQTEAERVGA